VSVRNAKLLSRKLYLMVRGSSCVEVSNYSAKPESSVRVFTGRMSEEVS
jgi:hypothetical protein